MSSRSAYPWFFFYRTARLTLLVFLPALFLILFMYRSAYRTGIIAHAQVELQEDLTVLQTALKTPEDWKRWCQEGPSLKNGRYLLKGETTEVCGGSNADESDVISAEMKITPQLTAVKIVSLEAVRERMSGFDSALFLRITPIALICYLVFLLMFYFSTRPLGTILSKVEKFKEDIPFNKSLHLLYKKDEWAAVEEALTKADQKLQDQVEEAKVENEKTIAILESINDAIIAIDRFDTVLFYNKNLEKNFIWNREGQEIDKKLWHLFPDEVLSAFHEVLSSGGPKSLKTMNFPLSRSPDRFFDLRITPLKTSSGAVTGALGVFYDVTDFKLTEQMRVDFVANVSHEIRTPLTSIRGFSQILQGQSEKVDESLRPFLYKIISNTERMISLFNDLLNLSVIESKNSLSTEEVPVLEVVESVKDNLPAGYPEKNIEIAHQLELEFIKADYRLIEQVVTNLCDNASKYAGDSVKIMIRSFKKNGKAYLTITDNGPGISKEHLPRIFERFYRIDASRESLRGTGLGLSIVKQIISKHKGKIWAESAGQGSGTTFVIELPLE